MLSRVGDVLSLASLLVLALHVKWLPLRASANEASEKRVAATTTVRASTAMLLHASALCEGAFMFDRSKTAFKTTFDVFRDLVEADKTADFADSLRSFMTTLTTKQAVYGVATSMLCIAASWAVLYSLVFLAFVFFLRDRIESVTRNEDIHSVSFAHCRFREGRR